MGIEIVDSKAGLVTVKVTGKLTKLEMDRAQRSAIEAMQQHGRIRILVIAEDFKGWDKSGDWGDLSFQEKYDEQIEKIAIVGEQQWEDLALAFTGKGLRPVAVEYFLDTDLAGAQAWIGQ